MSPWPNVVAAQARQQLAERHPVVLATPEPLYDAPAPPYHRPATLTSDEKKQALQAAHKVRQRYPGAAGDILYGELVAFNDLGYLGDPNGPIRRLIRELTEPQ